MNGGSWIKVQDGDLDRGSQVREILLAWEWVPWWLGVGTPFHRLFPLLLLEPPVLIFHPSLQPSLTIAHTFSVCPSGWNYSPLIELKTRGD